MADRKRTRRDLALLLVVGVAVNALAAQWVTQPGYTDAYYYFGGAAQLAQGRGFTEPYLWTYLAAGDAPAVAPAPGTQRWPSHMYWMPLTSIVAAPFMAGAEALAGTRLLPPALFRAA